MSKTISSLLELIKDEIENSEISDKEFNILGSISKLNVERISLLDCWNNNREFLTFAEICKGLCIKPSSSRACHIGHALKLYSENGILERKLIDNPSKRIIKKGKRKVWTYRPKEWIVNSICNGLFEENWDNLEK